jgi:Fe-S-cluster-containing dehydrogenase component
MGTSAGAGSMKKWAMIVDVAKCINCNNCVLATKDEHIGNEFPGYAAPQPAHGHEWISIERHTRGSGSMVDVSYVPTMCNHCDDAPCVKAAGDGAVYKRSDGIVIIDPVKARGRKELVSSCPYGQITWNEEEQVPQSWIFDAHLLDHGWTKPRCVQACPTGALESMHVSDENLQALAAREGLEVLRPEFSTKPRVFYRNLRRTYQCFIGGNVFRTRADGSQENVEGARVELSIDGVKVGDAQTDRFGDFKIDGLQGNAAKYRLRIFHNAFGQAETTGVLHKSDYLGAIPLTGRTS